MAYTGTLNITYLGQKCQMWSSQTPHGHGGTGVQYGDVNYCRNPDGENSPWCYTVDPDRRYEQCFNVCPGKNVVDYTLHFISASTNNISLMPLI